MKIVSLLIAVFVISMFASGFLGYYAFILNANGLSAKDFSTANDTSVLATQLEKMYNSSQTMQNNTNTGQQNYMTFAPWNLVIGAYDMVMQMIQAPVFFIALIGDLTSKMTGLPSWVATDLIAIVSIIVIWEIIYLIIGRK